MVMKRRGRGALSLPERIRRLIVQAAEAEAAPKQRALVLAAVRAGASQVRLAEQLGVTRQAVSWMVMRAKEEERNR